MLDAFASSGFAGLADGWGAYPMIAMDSSGEFQCSEGWQLGTEFYGVLQASFSKWIIKNGGEDDDEQFAYTYSSQHDPKAITTNGVRIYTDTDTGAIGLLDTWATKGFDKPQWKPYTDVVITVYGGEHHETEVICQIPDKSIPRFTRVMRQMARKYGASFVEDPAGAEKIVRFFRGTKVTKVKKAFFPWGFEEYVPPEGPAT